VVAGIGAAVGVAVGVVSGMGLVAGMGVEQDDNNRVKSIAKDKMACIG
jgi:hypothetical protein